MKEPAAKLQKYCKYYDSGQFNLSMPELDLILSVEVPDLVPIFSIHNSAATCNRLKEKLLKGRVYSC